MYVGVGGGVGVGGEGRLNIINPSDGYSYPQRQPRLSVCNIHLVAYMNGVHLARWIFKKNLYNV